MLYITGIGSRETPKKVLADMTTIGTEVRHLGMQLRSGHCDGADYAFECGAQQFCVAYLPWSGFNAKLEKTRATLMVPKFTRKVRELARAHHPVFDRLSEPAQKLIMRNGVQVLGRNLRLPSATVICWTKGGMATGGTAQGMSIAKAHGIPVINLFDFSLKEVLEALHKRANK